MTMLALKPQRRHEAQGEIALAATRSRMEGRGRRGWGDRNAAYILIAPTLLGILLVDAYPLVFNGVISLQDRKISTAHPSFVGLANYATVVHDPEMLHSIEVTIIFTLASVALSYLIGLALALLLNRPIRGRGLLRSIFIIPWAMPAFVVALVWGWMYNDQFGIITALAKGLGITHPPVLLSAQYALGSLTAVMVWKSFPFQFVVLLAGLSAVDSEVLQAAAVDGANAWQRFSQITFPLLKPISMVAILLAAINAFQYFPIPWILTQGGPANATNVVAISVYNTAFLAGNFGTAAAVAMLMFGAVVVMSAVYLLQYIREVQRLG
ncbi:MAG: carbohydrate ABC transporter permease [Chloroflexota bacterium]